MTECMSAEVRDALPDLLHGRLGDLDSATMKAHVESCADCRAELALMEHVRAHAPLAPSIDVSRIVSMLPAPIPSADQRVAPIAIAPLPSRMSIVWKVAVASALIVGGMLTFSKTGARISSGTAVATVAPSPSPSPSPSAAVDVASPTLTPAPKQVASAGPAASVLVKKVVPTSTSGLMLTGGLQDLTDAQLEALLNDVDNVDGLPTAEPEPINVSVDGDAAFQ